MVTGWRYRTAAVAGVAALTVVAVLVANVPAVQEFFQVVPGYDRFWIRTLAPGDFYPGLAMVLLVVGGSLWPLYKPQPRRVLDIISRSQKRVLLATSVLATVGYFDWTYRLPRPMLVLTAALLFVLVPVWFVTIRQQVGDEDQRILIVGDDPEGVSDILAALDRPVLGYVAPNSLYASETAEARAGRPRGVADGGRTLDGNSIRALPCLGGLSNLEDVLVNHDVDTVALSFTNTDRYVFFGTLDACYRHGVTAKVHREHADSVLIQNGAEAGELVEVDLAPWDWQDHVLKRAFDVAFAGAALLAVAPLLAVIALAIKLDSPGPVFYAQERTATFGETFTVYKFRTMVPDSEDPDPADDEEIDRITRVGRILRKTHVDELPQLWTVLTGTMSVVGPRAAWTEEENQIEGEAVEWRKRWFVKPGMTGLAQVNDIKSTRPGLKLKYDIQYIRQQHFWFDLMIVVRQVWKVVSDTADIARRVRN